MRKRKKPVLIPVRNDNNDGWEFVELWDYQDFKVLSHPSYTFIVHQSVSLPPFYEVSEKKTGSLLPIPFKICLTDAVCEAVLFLNRKTPDDLKEAFEKGKAMIEDIKFSYNSKNITITTKLQVVPYEPKFNYDE